MKKILNPLVVSLAVAALLPLSALAEINTQSVNITSSPPVTSYGPGQTSASLGTFVLSTPPGTSAQIYSLPLSLTTTNGGTAVDLSSCSFYNVNNFPIMTGGNLVSNLSTANGTSNVFNFDTPLTVTSSPMTLAIRCNISGNAVANGRYAFAAGTPNFVQFPSTSSLNADFTVFPTLIQGAQNAPVAAITLAAPFGGSVNYNVSSFPVTAVYGGGLSSAYLTNCMWKNEAGGVVSTVGTLPAGTSGVNLTTVGYYPYTLTAPTSLILSCNVDSTAPAGGIVSLNINRNTISATNAQTGATITPVAGSMNSLGGTAAIVASGSGSGTVTPPNTGGGAAAPVTAALISFGILAILAGAVLVMRREQYL